MHNIATEIINLIRLSKKEMLGTVDYTEQRERAA